MPIIPSSKSARIYHLEKELAAIREQRREDKRKITNLRRRVKLLKLIQIDPVKAAEPAPESSESSITRLEGKLLQLQHMLPDIVREWQSRKTIHLSRGTQATPRSKSMASQTSGRDAAESTIPVDESGRVPDGVWKLLPAHRKRRLGKRLAGDREYDPAKPAFTAIPRSCKPHTVDDHPTIDLTGDPGEPPEHRHIRRPCFKLPVGRESVSARLRREFCVDVDVTPRQ